MAIQIHDPGHVALRRGIRAAIGVPLSAVAALALLPKCPAGIVSVFGAFCLLAICDFGGTARRKVTSLLGVGAVGAVLVAVGVLASQNAVAAVVVTFIVGASLAFVPVLRGSVTSGAAALTIMYVVAITAGMPSSDVVKSVIGWLLAVVIAIPLALLVLPRRDLGPVRLACSMAVLAYADSVAARGRGQAPDTDALTTARDGLRHAYLGNPFRAAGLNHKDRALIAVAGQIEGLLSSMIHGRAYPTPMPDDEFSRRLNAQAAQALSQAGTALADSGASAPSGRALVETWLQQWDSTVATLVDSPEGERAQRIAFVADLFPDRAMAVASVRTVMLTRQALGLPDEQYPSGPDIPEIVAPAVSRGAEDLRAEATLRSPWARLALRTGLGLAIAVLVVFTTGLAHGLWVVLGVTSVLRFDGLTTARTAVYALIGTAAGAAMGYAILSVDSADKGALWALFIAVTFIAVWVPVAVGFAFGQAAFSVFVIVAVTIMTWPPDVATATDRIEDVAVGVVVSVVVALLLWPGGVLKDSVQHVADAVRSSTALLNASMRSLIVGAEGQGPSVAASTTATLRSQEVIELTLGSSAKGAAQLAYAWESLLYHLRVPSVVGRLMAGWAPHHGPIVDVVPQLQAPLMAELDTVVDEWSAVASEIDGQTGRPERSDATTIDQISAAAATADLRDAKVADRVVAAVWGFCWMQMSLRAGTACQVPVEE